MNVRRLVILVNLLPDAQVLQPVRRLFFEIHMVPQRRVGTEREEEMIPRHIPAVVEQRGRQAAHAGHRGWKLVRQQEGQQRSH